MQILSFVFTTLKWFGVWRPIESSEWKKNLYWIYTFFIILLLSLSLLSEIVYLVKFVKDIDEIAGSSFLLLTEACGFYKVTNILHRRKDIIRYTDSLTTGIGRPNSPEEVRIQEESDRLFRQDTIAYGGLVGLCVSSMYVTNYVNNISQRSLSYNACFPFDHSTDIGFWIACLYQFIAQGVSGILCVAYDTLFCGLMGQACAQLKILQYRLQSMPQTVLHSTKNVKKLNNDSPSSEEMDKRALQRCISHHHNIFKYTKLMNDVFGVVIFAQCAVSTFALCCSIYMFSLTKPFSPEFTSMTAYIICMLTQIFMYCWFGNEVMLESMGVRNAVYAMNWTKLKVRTQKNLLILMACTLEPIQFTSASIIVLSLDTYKSLLKLSYSMYNLLQRTSEQ